MACRRDHNSVHSSGFLCLIEFRMVLVRLFFGPVVLVHLCVRTDLDFRRLVSPVLIIPVSKLAKNSFRYCRHAVMILRAWTNSELIVTGHSANVRSSEVDARFRKTYSQMIAAITLPKT